MTHPSVALPEDVAERLTRLAESRGSTPSDLLADAARDLLDEAEAFERAIAEGEADVAAGRVHDGDAVLAGLRSWAADFPERPVVGSGSR